jgi:hypothetical protein
LTLIAGAGRKGPNSGFTRSQYFAEDFYFDKLDIQTIIGSDGTNGSTNSITFKFTIMEPLGLSLLNRLIKAAAEVENGDGKNNYLEMPYCIQLDFFGYPDAGLESGTMFPEGQPFLIPGMTKFLPFKFIAMDIKTGARGTEYNCEAIPFGANAFQEVIGAVPANFEVQAKDLDSFFDSATDAELEKIIGERDEALRKAEQAAKDIRASGRSATEDQIRDAIDARKAAEDKLRGEGDDNTYKVNSFVSAYNSWQVSMAKKGQADSFDQIRVEFAEQIRAQGRLVQDEVQPAKNTPQTDRGKPGDGASAKHQVLANAGKKTNGPKFDSSKFAVTAGTQVVEVINTMMKQTDYWREQFVNPVQGPAKDDSKETPLEETIPVVRAWKIIPQVILTSLDAKLGRYHFIATYYVIVHVKYNRKHPMARRAWPAGWHRTYEYLYTGKNTDVIDWQLNFACTFMTSVPADAASKSATQGQVAGEDPNAPGNDNYDSKAYAELTSSSAGGSNKKIQAGQGVNPNMYKLENDNIRNSIGGNARKDSKSQIAGSVFQSLYGESVDMIQIEPLTIIGDPGFIKQDEIFSNPSNDGRTLALTTQDLINGTNAYADENAAMINLDGAEVHVLLIFRSPSDFDDNTGLVSTPPEYQSSIVSGLYMVNQVTSEFSGGKFTQKLTLIRLADQDQELAQALAHLNYRTESTDDQNKDTGPSSGGESGRGDPENPTKDDNDPSDAQTQSTDQDPNNDDGPYEDGNSGNTNNRTTYDDFGTEITVNDQGYTVQTVSTDGAVSGYDAFGTPVSGRQDFASGNNNDLQSWRNAVDIFG